MTDPRGAAGAAPLLRVNLRVGERDTPVAWELSLLPDAMLFRREKDSALIKDTDLSGISAAGANVTLHSVAGSTVHIDGDARLATVASEIIARICSVGEVTRPLRGLGARRAHPGAEHNSFFEPLLAARRAAETQRDVQGRLEAFDADRLRGELDSAVRKMAVTRFPQSLPDQRALYETLNASVEPLYRELETLEAGSAIVRDAPAAQLFLRWREWISELSELFAIADRCWLEMLPILESHAPEQQKRKK